MSEKLPKGWKRVKLGEVADITRGASPRPIQTFLTNNSGIPWVKISDATATNNRYITKTKEFIKKEGKAKSVYVIPGDFIVSNSATPGLPRIMKIEACIHDGWLLLRNIKIEKEFLYYLFLYERKRLTREGSGTIFTNLKTDILKNFEVILPPLPEQKAIASVLSSLDDKIDLLHRQNQTLEQMAETLFRKWFIEPCKNGLPEGWEEKRFSDFIEKTLGGDWGKENLQSDYTKKVNCLRGTDIADLQTGIPSKTPVRFIKEVKFEKIKVLNGDIIIEISGGTENQSTGRSIYINDVNINLFSYPLVFSNFCRLLRPINSEFSYFLYLYLIYLYDTDEFFSIENGSSGIKNLDYKYLLNNFPIYAQKNEIYIFKFNEKVKNFFEKIDRNKLQICTLEKLRDTLLPKLMSGEVRVRGYKNIPAGVNS